MQHLSNVDLSNYHTFGLKAKAKELYIIESAEELPGLMDHVQGYQILGDGSNIVFVEDQETTLIKMATKGITIRSQNNDHVLIEVQAGECWHDFVHWTVERSFYGLENLALIPGSVGAAPVQNIGAYGCEIEQYIVKVRGYDIKQGTFVTLQHDQCQFSYRSSIFKESLREGFIISSVTFRLSMGRFTPNLSYKALSNYLSAKDPAELTQMDVFEAVINIRQSKLPDPNVVGNAGSFFKNPIVHQNLVQALRQRYPEMPSFEYDGDLQKIPAAWLIENCSWKGRQLGGVGVYEKHALVLINHNNGTPDELKTLIISIQMDVLETFGIALMPEVNIL